MAKEAKQMDPMEYEAWLEETLTPVEAAKFLSLKLGDLARRRHEGGGPKFHQLGHRTIRYVRRDLIAWRDDRSFASTAEYRTTAHDDEAGSSAAPSPSGVSR